MSLARAFTKRTKRPSHDLGRSGTVRDKISGPVGLVSTTNMLAYNAPDIRSTSASSSESPRRVSNESASSRGTSQSSNSHGGFLSSPNTTSPELSPIMPEPNHLSTYFAVPGSKMMNDTPVPAVPAIPTRALSHNKKSSQDLRSKPSRSRMAPPPTSISHSHHSTASTSSSRSHDHPSHPFSNELAQVNEVAEGFGLQNSVWDEEEQLLRTKGLFKFSVEDYLLEIEGVYGSGPYGSSSPYSAPTQTSAWI